MVAASDDANAKNGPTLFQQLLRHFPAAKIENYYQNGKWLPDRIEIDTELLIGHLKFAGAPDPPQEGPSLADIQRCVERVEIDEARMGVAFDRPSSGKPRTTAPASTARQRPRSPPPPPPGMASIRSQRPRSPLRAPARPRSPLSRAPRSPRPRSPGSDEEARGSGKRQRLNSANPRPWASNELVGGWRAPPQPSEGGRWVPSRDLGPKSPPPRRTSSPRPQASSTDRPPPPTPLPQRSGSAGTAEGTTAGKKPPPPPPKGGPSSRAAATPAAPSGGPVKRTGSRDPPLDTGAPGDLIKSLLSGL
eukprot:TRINITY_DN27434_c0_g2_i1.p1 TRINITY_DN27434_c0_g2~~TRINITY_DN27434_c0_g2_i1.p1  ORF type:complete len:305 (+),score=37.92 TRINITY_DN27434_c0_g2_i1:148-1062(+)